MTELNGHCLCKDVTFKVAQPSHLDSCHCETCRRWSGGAYIGLDFTEVTFEADKGLKWFRSSDWAERGFCQNCGTSLFYRLVENKDKVSVCAGAVNGLADDTPMTKEFFIDQKPAFYSFEGEREQLTGAEVFAMYGAEQEE